MGLNQMISISKLPDKMRKPLFCFLLQLGDDQLLLGHYLSMWCGHGPILEEDLALSNLALDCLGQAQLLLTLAGKVEGVGRDADKLSFFRNEGEFYTHRICEFLPGDFSYTIARHYFFLLYWQLYLEDLQKNCQFKELKEIIAKMHQETIYPLTHVREWIYRLADGTKISREKLELSVNQLLPYCGDLFLATKDEIILNENQVISLSKNIFNTWLEKVEEDFLKGTLDLSSKLDELAISVQSQEEFLPRPLFHLEDLGHTLSEMQSVARNYQEVGANVSW